MCAPILFLGSFIYNMYVVFGAPRKLNLRHERTYYEISRVICPGHRPDELCLQNYDIYRTYALVSKEFKVIPQLL